MSTECPVCLETYTGRVRSVLPCDHSLCLQCLARLPRPARCPLCRQNVESCLLRPKERGEERVGARRANILVNLASPHSREPVTADAGTDALADFAHRLQRRGVRVVLSGRSAGSGDDPLGGGGPTSVIVLAERRRWPPRGWAAAVPGERLAERSTTAQTFTASSSSALAPVRRWWASLFPFPTPTEPA